jgi:hypothetical protein
MARQVGKYGRRSPKNAPALKLGPLLTGTVPAHPASADYLTRIGGWKMLGNADYGDCVAVAMGNIRKVMTATLGEKPYDPTLDDVLAFYKTQNPKFPSQDDGMDEQTALEDMLSHGDLYYDGVKPLAFAKVDVANEQELDAAVAIFGPSLIGITVTNANEDEFSAGKPWDYVSGSPDAGGHAVVQGGYDESTKTGEFETWAEITRYTDRFRQQQLQEFWAIIWPEHLRSKAFMEGVDQAALATAYTALTGRPFPVQPAPTPTPAPVGPVTPPAVDPVDQALAVAQLTWEQHEDNMKTMRSCDRTLETANRAWRAAKGLKTQGISYGSEDVERFPVSFTDRQPPTVSGTEITEQT